jgi:hypothetical protein
MFITVQWPFADFLMSPAAANPFFGTIYRDYLEGPQSYEARNLFVTERPGTFWPRMAWALFGAILLTRMGIGCGDWMRRIRR